MLSSSRLTALLAFTAAGSLGGCSDLTRGTERGSVSLSFATAAPASLAASLNAASTGSSLVITRAQLVFEETELEVADGACLAAGNDDDCPEIESGPVLVELPLDASANLVVTAAIPVGTYEEFEAEIDVADSDDPEDASAVEAFLAANPQFRGVSIRVEGTFNGEPFVYTTDVSAELEFEFAPPLVVTEGSHNITVAVDVARWFRAGDGSTIDPRTAVSGGANKSIVDNNIKMSFEAFEDDDRNGHED